METINAVCQVQNPHTISPVIDENEENDLMDMDIDNEEA